MNTIYKAKDFVSKVKDIAENYNTVYCWGSFGFPITESNIERLAKGYPKIYTAGEKAKLKGLIGKNYFGFDCVGLIKCCLTRKTQKIDTQNPKFQQAVEIVENFANFVQIIQIQNLNGVM